MFRANAAWTATHKYARITLNHVAVLGFWYARDESGCEFAINIGRTFYVRRDA